MSGQRVDAKVVMLGKEYVGKTSLVERYVHNRFLVGPYQNTIGAAFVAKVMPVGGRTVTLGIWDTAGSERYEAMSRIYYRGAKAAIVCYGALKFLLSGGKFEEVIMGGLWYSLAMEGHPVATPDPQEHFFSKHALFERVHEGTLGVAKSGTRVCTGLPQIVPKT